MKKIVLAALAASMVVSPVPAFAGGPSSQSILPDRFRCGFFNFFTALGTGNWPMYCPDPNVSPYV